MATTSKQCYYDVLGIPRDASTDEIKAAYKRIAKQAHPDRLAIDTPADERASAAEKFKAAAEAWECLGDQSKRAKYDAYGFAGVGSAAGGDDMFEQMFGVGAGTMPRKALGVVSATLFVDSEHGAAFFQRRVPTADIAMGEAAEGLPEAAAMVSSPSGGEYTATAALPAGPWEVKLVEVEGATMTVVFGVDEAAQGEWGELNADLKAVLRVSRPFVVPADGDALAADVTVGEGTVSVRMPSKAVSVRTAAADGTTDGTMSIGTRIRLTGLRRTELNDREGTIVAEDDGAGRLGVLVDGEAKPIAIKRANLAHVAIDDAATSTGDDSDVDPASVMMPIDEPDHGVAPSKTLRRASRQRKKVKRAAGKRAAEAIAMEIDQESAMH